MKPRFTPASELLTGWLDDVRSGRPPTLFPIAAAGSSLARLEVGPGLVDLFGGPPGVGKSALVTQFAFEALHLSPNLKALVANVEMSPATLLDRQFARLSGIDLHTVRHRKLTACHEPKVDAGLQALGEIIERVAFMGPPFSVENVAKSAEAFGADLIVLDYIQRFAPPGEHAQRKAAVDALMDYVRGMADCGVAVLVVAAVGRQRDEKGRSSYGGLNLASFRESSELEYGADDAWILVRDEPDIPEGVTLKHVKSRHGEEKDIPIRFAGAYQRFDVIDAEDEGKLSSAVRDVWKRKKTENDEDADGGEW